MSDLKIKPEFRQCFVTYVESDGKTVTVWAQNQIKEVFKFETIRDSNYRQMFCTFFETKRESIKPLVDKHYIFCDKSSANFYRVLVKRFDPEVNEALVFFIDFGFEELVATDCLFVFTPLFIDCRPLVERFLLSAIRPKDVIKGFDSQRVVKSLEKYLRSVLMFAIYGDQRIKVYNNGGEDIFNTCLLNDGIDDIVFETNDSIIDLIAIDFDNDSESNRNSLTITSDFKSAQSLNHLISYSSGEEAPKTVTKNIELSSDLIDLNDTRVVQSIDQSYETTVSEVNSRPIDSVFSDKTDKKSLIFHMKTLFGPKRDVYVTKTLSSKSIYVQLKEEWDSVEDLVQRMNVCYKDCVEEDEYSLKIEEISKDSVIAAQFTQDNNWYRASVIDVKPNKRLVKLFYIDFGNKEIIDLKFCRFLKPQFKELAPQAIHCRPLNEGLGADTLEIFETNTQEIECHFVGLNDDMIMDVLLYDNGVLLSGDSVISSPQRPKPFEIKTIKSQIVEKFELKKVQQKNEISEELSQKAILTKHVLKETEESLKSLEGINSTAVISNANNSQSFYCQLLKCLNETIGPLVEDMTDFYSELKDFQFLTDFQFNYFKDNQILIAVYYELENKWLRAKVLQIVDEESVNVLHVDYGTEEKVNRNYCRQLDDIYLKPILQAIHCRPINKNVSYYELKKMESSKPFVITFVELKENNIFDVFFKL